MRVLAALCLFAFHAIGEDVHADFLLDTATETDDASLSLLQVYAARHAQDEAKHEHDEEGVEEAKLSFRKLFHDHPDMLMEMVEYSFSQPEQRQRMSKDWDKVSQRTQQTILAHACRREADKALRYVNFDTLMEDLKSDTAFFDTSVGNQAGCTDIFGADPRVLDNQSLDCLNMAASFAEIFDPTPISFLVGHATDVDWCPDINDPNDLHYNPRAKLSTNHPWYSVKEKLANGLNIPGTISKAPHVKDSRGDGESMFHQLRRKMLSETCPNRYKFSKGVCRPASMNQFSKFSQNRALWFDTTPQVMYVDEGSQSHDQCCDKEGMTTIRTESDCRKAAKELRPLGRYLGRVNKNTIPYGCYADIRNQDVGFNTNQQNSNLEGLYEPICGAGVNKYKIREFNIIRAANGYVMGDLGETCPDSWIVQAKDCQYALKQLSPGASFGKMVGSTSKMGACSLQADESKGFYNDKHPLEKEIKTNDPPSYCDWQCYMDRYPDVRDFSGGNELWANMHYLWIGIGEGRDCKCDGPAIPKGGSYPICYQDGVLSRSRGPVARRHEYWSETYWVNPTECRSGYYRSRKTKSCGFLGYCLLCWQPYLSCDPYPNHILVTGRKLSSTELLPVGYCLDKTKLGNH